VHVHTVRAGFAQSRLKPWLAIIDGGIEAELVQAQAALGFATGNSDRTATMKAGKLPDDGAHRTGSGGDNHRFSLLRLSGCGQAEVGSDAVQAQNAERQGE